MRIDFSVRIGFRAWPGYLCRCPSTMGNGYNPVLYANGIDLRSQVNAVARLWVALKLLNGYCGITVVTLHEFDQGGRGRRRRQNDCFNAENLITLRYDCYRYHLRINIVRESYYKFCISTIWNRLALKVLRENEDVECVERMEFIAVREWISSSFILNAWTFLLACDTN